MSDIVERLAEPASEPERPEAWHLIEAPAGGERQLVRDPESYPGWTVLTADLERYPGEYERLEEGAMVTDLACLEADLLAAIDREADAFRSSFITNIAGQQMLYLTKEAEARAMIAGGDPAEAPMIVGGALARGIEPIEMAAIVIGKADYLRSLGAQSEIVRDAAKARVSAAATADEKRTAAIIDWNALLGPSGKAS